GGLGCDADALQGDGANARGSPPTVSAGSRGRRDRIGRRGGLGARRLKLDGTRSFRAARVRIAKAACVAWEVTMSDKIDPLALFRLDGRVAIVTGASSG